MRRLRRSRARVVTKPVIRTEFVLALMMVLFGLLFAASVARAMTV